jgi:hypothetical protein
MVGASLTVLGSVDGVVSILHFGDRDGRPSVWVKIHASREAAVECIERMRLRPFCDAAQYRKCLWGECETVPIGVETPKSLLAGWFPCQPIDH